MNASSKKTGFYVLGVAVLCLLIILGWFAFHQEPPPPSQQPVKAEATKPVAPALEPTDDSSSETPTNQPENSITTNAADLYRQAFDLFKALTNDERFIVSDWRTNVDASVEAELCEKLRPICDLMHQASAVTNCDWGIDPTDPDPGAKWLTHLNGSRNLARAAIWNAAHCRSNDVVGVMDDTLSALRVGQQVSRSALIGCLVDMAVQSIVSSYVAENLSLFRGTDGQRLAAAFDDPAYEEEPSRGMEQEADRLDRLLAKLPSLPADEAQKEISDLFMFSKVDTSEMSQDLVLAQIKQIAGSERELAKALASSSEDQLEVWQQDATALESSNPLAKEDLSANESFLNKVRWAEINRALVVAGFAVAQAGANALPSYPDPSSGQPFVYTETSGGFQLQSAYQMNGKPMTMQFKSR